jgi:hypothetical protein
MRNRPLPFRGCGGLFNVSSRGVFLLFRCHTREAGSAVPFSCPGRFLRGLRPTFGASLTGGGMGLAGQGAMRSGGARLALERFPDRPGTPRVGLGFPRSLLQVTFGLLDHALRGAPFLWRGQFHARTTRLRQSNGYGLFGGSGAVFALADVLHLFADKFARLSGSRFTFASIFSRSFNRLSFRHT